MKTVPVVQRSLIARHLPAQATAIGRAGALAGPRVSAAEGSGLVAEVRGLRPKRSPAAVGAARITGLPPGASGKSARPKGRLVLRQAQQATGRHGGPGLGDDAGARTLGRTVPERYVGPGRQCLPGFDDRL